MQIINAGYPKDGTPESRAHWAKVRAGLPRFTYTPPDNVDVSVPRWLADEVRALVAKRTAEAGRLPATIAR